MKLRFDGLHKLTHYEYWPAWAFYLPVYLLWPYFVWKGKSFFFFTAANPSIPLGGSFGESKYDILKLIDPKYIPETKLINTKEDLKGIKDFPIIGKPDVGERGNLVSLIRSEGQLYAYWEKLQRPFLVQEYLASSFEAGVMVHRDPQTRRLEISSIAVKGYLSIVGDGKKTIQDLIYEFPRARFQWERLKSEVDGSLILKNHEELVLEPIGNHCRGTTFLNRNDLITHELTEALDEALKNIDGFYFGRFDLKAHSAEALSQGKTIKIMELNGALSEPGHIYDPKEKLLVAWADLLSHWKRLAFICRKNQERGHRPTGLREFASLYAHHRKLNQRTMHE